MGLGMNWEAIGAIGDFIGGIAVVAGLIFVGLQLRTANREARIVANQKYADVMIDIAKQLSSTQEMSDIFSRGLVGLDALEQGEKARFITLVGSIILRSWENLHAYNVEGKLEARTWRGSEQSLKSLVVTKGFDDVWGMRRNWFGPSFQIYIDKPIQERTDQNLLDEYGVEAQKRIDA
jgi:hypothetical protein